MSRISKAFEKADEPLLNIYFTAGHPEKDSTVNIIKSLESSGADLIELGMPYSDPLADGTTIQESSAVALKNGMSIEVLFEQLEPVREDVDIPIILMGYLNPVMQFGIEEFCKKCKEVGIDGLILPDVPIEIFENEYGEIFKKYGLDFIFLITPETPIERIEKIDKLSSGFIYMVSSSSTTGTAAEFSEEQIAYFKKVQDMNLQNPTMIGFGISDKNSFDTASSFSNGAIVGSAFIKHLSKESNHSSIEKFVKSIKS